MALRTSMVGGGRPTARDDVVAIGRIEPAGLQQRDRAVAAEAGGTRSASNLRTRRRHVERVGVVADCPVTRCQQPHAVAPSATGAGPS